MIKKGACFHLLATAALHMDVAKGADRGQPSVLCPLMDLS